MYLLRSFSRTSRDASEEVSIFPAPLPIRNKGKERCGDDEKTGDDVLAAAVRGNGGYAGRRLG